MQCSSLVVMPVKDLPFRIFGKSLTGESRGRTSALGFFALFGSDFGPVRIFRCSFQKPADFRFAEHSNVSS